MIFKIIILLNSAWLLSRRRQLIRVSDLICGFPAGQKGRVCCLFGFQFVECWDFKGVPRFRSSGGVKSENTGLGDWMRSRPRKLERMSWEKSLDYIDCHD